MAKETPGIGHNVDLTDEQQEALQTRNEVEWQQLLAKEEEANGVLKSIRKQKTAVAKRVHTELGVTREAWDRYITDLKMDPAEFMEKQAAEERLYRIGGLREGAQQDLPLGDTVDDQVAAEKAGRKAYRANKDPSPPAEISPILHQAWMSGWQDEQRKVAMQMQMAAEIDKASAAPTEPDPEPEAEEEFDPDSEARKLKRSKFMDRSEALEEATA